MRRCRWGLVGQRAHLERVAEFLVGGLQCRKVIVSGNDEVQPQKRLPWLVLHNRLAAVLAPCGRALEALLDKKEGKKKDSSAY